MPTGTCTAANHACPQASVPKNHVLTHPHLQQLAKKYICIPATSVAAEQLFSKAGKPISKRKACLKPKNVNMLLFLNKIFNVIFQILIVVLVLPNTSMELLNIGIEMKNVVSPSTILHHFV